MKSRVDTERNWYCFLVSPGKEKKVADIIVRTVAEVQDCIPSTLGQGFVLAKFSFCKETVRKIASIRSVRGLVGRGDAASAISDSEIARLREGGPFPNAAEGLSVKFEFKWPWRSKN